MVFDTDNAVVSGGESRTIWYVYIVECRDASLYTGATNNLARRIMAHNQGNGGNYTRARRPVRLVYWETQPTRAAAQKREAAIKRLPRREKLSLRRNAIVSTPA